MADRKKRTLTRPKNGNAVARTGGKDKPGARTSRGQGQAGGKDKPRARTSRCPY